MARIQIVSVCDQKVHQNIEKVIQKIIGSEFNLEKPEVNDEGHYSCIVDVDMNRVELMDKLPAYLKRLNVNDKIKVAGYYHYKGVCQELSHWELGDLVTSVEFKPLYEML